MQNMQNTEILQADPREARDREWIALDRSIALMELAEEAGASLIDSTSAIIFTNKLWSVIIEDLASSNNELPHELRARIISIGIWILRELDEIRSEPGKNFDDLIVISRAIRDGLL